MTKPER